MSREDSGIQGMEDALKSGFMLAVVIGLHAMLLYWLAVTTASAVPAPELGTVTVSLELPPATQPAMQSLSAPLPAELVPSPLPPAAPIALPLAPPMAPVIPATMAEQPVTRETEPIKPTHFDVHPASVQKEQTVMPAAPVAIPQVDTPPVQTNILARNMPVPAAITPPNFTAAYLANPHPAYPRRSRSAGEEGRVQLRVWVTSKGEAEQVVLALTSGHKRLDEAAMEAVRSWRFVPAKQEGVSVSAWVVVPINFKLKS